MNADYSFSFFDNARMNAYMEACYSGHPILRLYHEVRMPAEKADIWRYCILYREGGIYCDIKSTLTVPFRKILPADATELVSYSRNLLKDYLDIPRYADPSLFLAAPPRQVKERLECPEHPLVNWLLCFEKESPILGELIELIVRSAPFYRGKRYENPHLAGIHFTGPLALTQAVWKWMEKTGQQPTQCGIDFRGKGIWRLRGMDYRESPHHSTMSDMALLE